MDPLPEAPPETFGERFELIDRGSRLMLIPTDEDPLTAHPRTPCLRGLMVDVIRVSDEFLDLLGVPDVGRRIGRTRYPLMRSNRTARWRVP